jgi:hypothetical protein
MKPLSVCLLGEGFSPSCLLNVGLGPCCAGQRLGTCFLLGDEGFGPDVCWMKAVILLPDKGFGLPAGQRLWPCCWMKAYPCCLLDESFDPAAG